MRLLKEDEYRRPRRATDFPWFGGDVLLLKRRAVDKLGDLLRHYGELLPLACDDGDLYVFNVTCVLDALDLSRSSLVRFRTSGRVMKVDSYVFRPERIVKNMIFKLPEDVDSSIFFTDDLPDVLAEAGLDSADFRLLWDGERAVTPASRRRAN